MDNNPEKPEVHTVPLSMGDPRSAQANINKIADGYEVTVSLKDAGVHERRRRAPSTATPRPRPWRGRSRHSWISPGTRSRWFRGSQRY